MNYTIHVLPDPQQVRSTNRRLIALPFIVERGGQAVAAFADYNAAYAYAWRLNKWLKEVQQEAR